MPSAREERSRVEDRDSADVNRVCYPSSERRTHAYLVRVPLYSGGRYRRIWNGKDDKGARSISLYIYLFLKPKNNLTIELVYRQHTATSRDLKGRENQNSGEYRSGIGYFGGVNHLPHAPDERGNDVDADTAVEADSAPAEQTRRHLRLHLMHDRRRRMPWSMTS